MDTTFIDALKVPAILSTLRKIQHDSDSALRILSAYYRRHVGTPERAPLDAAEKEALSDVLANAIEQSLGAVVLFIGAHGAFIHGGVAAGQIAQFLISINAMTAPKSQFVNPGRMFGRWSGRDGMRNLDLLPGPACTVLAFELGRLAEATGYRGCPSTAEQACEPSQARVLGRPIISLAPLPGTAARPSIHS